MKNKAAFLCQNGRGHLGLDTALGQVLAEMTAKAAIHKHGLDVVE